jgi:hypothetical protein
MNTKKRIAVIAVAVLLVPSTVFGWERLVNPKIMQLGKELAQRVTDNEVKFKELEFKVLELEEEIALLKRRL